MMETSDIYVCVIKLCKRIIDNEKPYFINNLCYCFEECESTKLVLNSNMNSVGDRFFLRILSDFGDFVQAEMYAFTDDEMIYPYREEDLCTKKIYIKLDNPLILILKNKSDLFDSGHLYYIFWFSREPICKEKIYRTIGVMNKNYITEEDLTVIIKNLQKKSRINDFWELQKHIEMDKSLARDTYNMVQRTILYHEGFKSEKQPKKTGKVSFEESPTMIAVQRNYNKNKRMAVLCFANPVEPGGGVVRGLNAQEEHLCRSTNLYYSLSSDQVREYYLVNQRIIKKNGNYNEYIGTDQIIYSPDVMILKENEVFRNFIERKEEHFTIGGEETYIASPYTIDVITCSAPFLKETYSYIMDGDLEHILEYRIKNIFETAIEHDIDVLILGAFGCGNFHNPSEIVANVFRNLILTERYAKAFDHIVFAVKRDNIISNNIEAFQSYFASFPLIEQCGSEKMHRLFWKYKCPCGAMHAWNTEKCPRCGRQKMEGSFITVIE